MAARSSGPQGQGPYGGRRSGPHRAQQGGPQPGTRTAHQPMRTVSTASPFAASPQTGPRPVGRSSTFVAIALGAGSALVLGAIAAFVLIMIFT